MATVLRNGSLHKASITDALAVALARRIKPDDQIKPGVYQIRGTVTVKIDVHLKKGKPTTFRIKELLTPEEILEIAFCKAGVAKDKIPCLMLATAEEVKRRTKLSRPLPREGATNIVGEAEIVSFQVARS